MTFNVAMSPALVRYGTSLVLAQGPPQGSSERWDEVAPLWTRSGRRQPHRGARPTLQEPPLDSCERLSARGGPSAQSPSGVAMGYPSVTDFVLTSERSATTSHCCVARGRFVQVRRGGPRFEHRRQPGHGQPRHLRRLGQLRAGGTTTPVA